jgi:hypothetical protein
MGSGAMFVAAGGLTVRKADVLSGAGMTREANAGGRKATGNLDTEPDSCWSSGITGRIGTAVLA